MRTDNIKKYVLPNIPYLFVLWACLKLGTAYRLAAGVDFAGVLHGVTTRAELAAYPHVAILADLTPLSDWVKEGGNS